MARERTTYVYLPRSVRSLYKYMYSRGVYMSASTLQVLGCDHPLAQNCQYRANYFLRSTIRFYLTVYASSSGRLGVKEIRWQKRRKETYDMALSFVQCYAIATLTLVASWVYTLCVCVPQCAVYCSLSALNVLLLTYLVPGLVVYYMQYPRYTYVL